MYRVVNDNNSSFRRVVSDNRKIIKDYVCAIVKGKQLVHTRFGLLADY